MQKGRQEKDIRDLEVSSVEIDIFRSHVDNQLLSGLLTSYSATSLDSF